MLDPITPREILLFTIVGIVAIIKLVEWLAKPKPEKISFIFQRPYTDEQINEKGQITRRLL